MSSESIENDNWSIPCFDNNDWEPTAEELDNMYKLLENGTELQLEWVCPGRRPPTPVDKQTIESKEIIKEVETKNKDYDFMDEMNQTPQQMRIRSSNSTPKGSAKKKTTVFAGVLDSMKKHGRLTSGTPSTPLKISENSS